MQFVDGSRADTPTTTMRCCSPMAPQDVAASIDGLHPNAAGYAKMTAKSNFYEKQRNIRSAALRTAMQGHP
jgi:hypothetical protein